MLHTIYLGLGSNLGNREETILKAYDEIQRLIGTIKCRSAFYYSEPWGFESSNGFVNTVIQVETQLSPRQVLHTTQRIERLLGKTKAHATDRPTGIGDHEAAKAFGDVSKVVFKDRPIDIDILLYDNLVIDKPDLKIPHPLMHERPFVMEPLNEVKGEK